jgi:hypothetical protein
MIVDLILFPAFGLSVFELNVDSSTHSRFYTIKKPFVLPCMLFTTLRLGDISQCPLKPKARRNARKRFESAAPSRGTKRAKPESRTDRLQSLSRVRTLCRASPKIGIGKLFGLKFRIFSDFRSTFFFPKKRLNFGSAQNAQKSLKSDLGSFLAPILVAFWTPFGTNFLNISRFPENLYFATSPQRNAHFHLPNPLILEQIFDQILMFFGSRFRTPFFRHFSNMIPKNMIFGPPLGSSSVQNGTQNRPSCAKSREKSIRLRHFWGSWNKPVFL